jgi:hypothetical protein
MATARTKPYVSPKPEFVEAGPWMDERGEVVADETYLRKWDSAKDLAWTRVIKVRAGSDLASARIPSGSRLSIVSSWWSPATATRDAGPVTQIVVEPDSVQEIPQKLHAPGSRLRRSIHLRTAVTLHSRAAGAPLDSLAPFQRGSVLWDDRTTVILEGKAPRFPITAVSFPENDLGEANSCWRLDWSGELEAPAMGALRLWLNTANDNFYAAVVSPEKLPENGAVRSSLRFSVANELLGFALARADEMEHASFESGSSGRVFADLITRLFPRMSIAELSALRLTSPSEYSVLLQSRMGLFSKNSFDPLQP